MFNDGTCFAVVAMKFWSTSGIYFWLLLFLFHDSDLLQAVFKGQYVHATDSALLFQHKGLQAFEEQLVRSFSNISDRVMNNKLNSHFEDHKTKFTLHTTKGS